MALLQGVLGSRAYTASVIGASILWSKLLRGVAAVPPIFADFAAAKSTLLLALDAPAATPLPVDDARGGRSTNRRRRGAAGRPLPSQRPPASGSESAAAALAAMLSLVSEVVSSLLGTEVAPDQPLMEAGLDSLGE